MDTSKPQCAKQLKEHLQHYQEPFSLQCYLIERSYMFKNFSSDDCRNIHSSYSAKNLKWSIKCDHLHKIRKSFIHATGVLRSLLYKFIPTVDNHEYSSSWDEEHNTDPYFVHEITAEIRATQQTNSLKKLAISDHFTNNDVLPCRSHNPTLVNMFQPFTVPKLRRSEVDTGTEQYWISSKLNRQQYRGRSKWKEPLANAVCNLKGSEGQVTALASLSQKLVVRDYLRKLLGNSNILKSRSTKRDKLQGTLTKMKHVEKDREFHKNEGKSVSITKAVSESFMHGRFSFLEKQYREVKKMSHLLYTESCVITEEWKSFQIVNWEIYMEIGDSITDDIVREIIDLF